MSDRDWKNQKGGEGCLEVGAELMIVVPQGGVPEAARRHRWSIKINITTKRTMASSLQQDC